MKSQNCERAKHISLVDHFIRSRNIFLDAVLILLGEN